MDVTDLYNLEPLQTLGQVVDGYVDGKAAIPVGIAHHAVGKGYQGHPTGDQGSLTQKARPTAVPFAYRTDAVHDPLRAPPEVVQQ